MSEPSDKPKKIKIGKTEYPALSEEDVQEEFRKQDELTAKEQKANLQMLQAIQKEADEKFDVEYNNETIFQIRRLTDGEYTRIISEFIDILPKLELLNDISKLNKQEFGRLMDFLYTIMATSVHLPVEYRDPEMIRSLAREQRTALQDKVLLVNVFSINPKKLNTPRKRGKASS